jgi:Uma2 family endonuclease
MSPDPKPITTIEELLALPEDGLRHELLDGEHVVTSMPSLSHQLALTRLFELLMPALSEQTDLKLFFSPADIVLGPRTLVQPDLFMFRIDPASPPTSWEEAGIPVMVAEVPSQETAGRDRIKKRKIYQRAGVTEYWIVDLDAQLVERWCPGDVRPEILDKQLAWPRDGEPLLTLDVEAVFQHWPRPSG